jgi:hypothetical protein
MKLRRALLVLLLSAGGVFVSAQSATSVPLDQAIRDAGTFAGNHLAPETMTVLLNFTAPTRELINRCSDGIKAGLNAMGVGSILELGGDLIDSDAINISMTIGVETIVIGSLDPVGTGYQLRLRTIQPTQTVNVSKYAVAVQLDDTPVARAAPQTAPAPAPSPTGAAVAAAPEPAPAPQVAAAPEPAGAEPVRDFSVGRRIASAAMNPLFGLGSYLMGDWKAGLAITIVEAVGGGLILWEVLGVTWETKIGDYKLAGLPGMVGIGVAGSAVIFGFIRPFFYHRPDSKLASALSGARLAVIPEVSPQGGAGIKAVSLSYSFSF